MSTPTTTRYTIHVAVPGHVQGVLAAVGLTSLLTMLCTTRLVGRAAAAASFVTCKSAPGAAEQQLGGGFAAV